MTGIPGRRKSKNYSVNWNRRLLTSSETVPSSIYLRSSATHFKARTRSREFRRVSKGQTSLIKLFIKARSAGIIYDSKNHQAWRDQFVTKLREDQLAAKADFAVLSTAAFPSGKKGLYIADCEVIVATPAQVSHLARLLRQFLVTLHVRGLTLKQRAGKTNQLFQYITGEYAQRFSQISLLNQDLQEIDVQKQNAHRKVWKKRGELLVSQQKVVREIEGEIALILESDAGSESSAA